MNTDLCDYFKDKDFINLLNIIKTKPEYLEMVNSYLSHGDIIEEIDFDNINIENFEYTEQYDILIENVMPNICNWNEEKVKKILTKYEGNVNLTSRYIFSLNIYIYIYIYLMNGIINLGNTCYMNSVLQLLLNCNNFNNIIKKYRKNIINQIYKFIDEYFNSNSPVRPTNLKKCIEKN